MPTKIALSTSCCAQFYLGGHLSSHLGASLFTFRVGRAHRLLHSFVRRLPALHEKRHTHTDTHGKVCRTRRKRTLSYQVRFRTKKAIVPQHSKKATIQTLNYGIVWRVAYFKDDCVVPATDSRDLQHAYTQKPTRTTSPYKYAQIPLYRNS